MKLLPLAARGLLRNRRRSLVTLLAIALGFTAIALFAGYTHNIYRGLALQAIHGELLGHLTLSRRGMSREGKLDPERYLLTADDIRRITALLRRDTRGACTIFMAEGLDPAAARTLRAGLAQGLPDLADAHDGVSALDPAKPDQLALATGLAGLLHLAPGGQAALLTNTLFGQANALDVTIGGVFDTGNAGTNDLFAFMPLELVRSLYDAAGRADRLTVLLQDVRDTQAVRADLLRRLGAAGLDLEVHTWEELSAFYRQVHGMFDMIFGFIFCIVLTVVLMSVANSMGMAVVERTREIGTLRALGLRRVGVVRLFAAEAALLTLLGCGIGLLLTLGVRWGINAAHISYVHPNETSPVPLLVDLDGRRILATALMLVGVGALAAWLPARRAARQPIIDALGHV
jgi:putative ABC transport system permease protein